MIASHYASPVNRKIAEATALRARPAEDGDTVAELAAGDAFAMLDNQLGWAWGYAGPDRRVGYVAASALVRI